MGAGSSGDLFGLKRVFLVGVACYTIAVLAISLTPDLYAVFGLRVVQGIGTGTLLAAAPAIAGRAFPRSRRGRVMGVAFGSQALGLVAATLGAGVLVEAAGWQSIFWARAPLGLATFAAGWLFLPSEDGRGHGRSLDVLGALTLSGSLVALVIGLHVGGRDGWASALVVVMLVCSPLLLLLFWYVERHARWPALDMRLLRLRGFVAPFSAAFLSWMGVFVLWFIFPFYLTDVLQRGSSAVGVMLAVMAIAMCTAALLGGWLSDKAHARNVGMVGLLMLAGGLTWMSYLGEEADLLEVGARIAVVGAGLGVTQTAAYALMITCVPDERSGTASGALGLAESMGRVISVAVFGSLFAIRMDHHLALLASSSLIQASTQPGAFVPAFHEVLLVAAGLCLAGMVALLAIMPAISQAEEGPDIIP